jgi:Methyltransferase domain
MRDLGFDFRWSDAFAENLLARGFEQQPDCKYDLVTAFEVLEHLPNPLDEISRMMALADDVLVSTEILSNPPPKPGEWWYYTLSTGQHISFYSRKTLKVIARKFNRYVVSAGGIHLFSKSPVSRLRFNLVANKYLARITKLIARRRSLIRTDFERFTT